MYPNLQHEKLASSIAEFYKTNLNWLKPYFLPLNIKLPPPDFIQFALLTVLQNNVISFNGLFYKPVKGIQMGASCSVTIADLYMHIHFESKLQLHHWKIFFFFYYRFIDDNLQTIINNFSKLASLPFTGTTPNLIY